jgi:hypothetical protein
MGEKMKQVGIFLGEKLKKVLKVNWTSLNFKSASTWQPSLSNTFCKIEIKETNPNGMFKTLILFDGEQKLVGREKFCTCEVRP